MINSIRAYSMDSDALYDYLDVIYRYYHRIYKHQLFLQSSSLLTLADHLIWNFRMEGDE